MDNRGRIVLVGSLFALMLSSTALFGSGFQEPNASDKGQVDVAFQDLSLDVNSAQIRLKGELLNQSDQPLTHIRVETNCTLLDGSSINVILDTTENYVTKQVRNRRTNQLETRRFPQPIIIEQGQRFTFDITKRLSAKTKECSTPTFMNAVNANRILE